MNQYKQALCDIRHHQQQQSIDRRRVALVESLLRKGWTMQDIENDNLSELFAKTTLQPPVKGPPGYTGGQGRKGHLMQRSENKSPHAICGAQTRKGDPCQNKPMANGRCRMHGGKSLKGKQSGTYKHGLYSQYLGPDLQKILADIEDEPSESLTDPKQEIQLMKALIMSAEALRKDAQDLETLDALSQLINRLVLAKQRSQAILIEKHRLIPVQDIEAFLDHVRTVIEAECPDTVELVMKKIKSFRVEE